MESQITTIFIFNQPIFSQKKKKKTNYNLAPSMMNHERKTNLTRLIKLERGVFFVKQIKVL